MAFTSKTSYDRYSKLIKDKIKEMGLFDLFKRKSSNKDPQQELISKIIRRYFDGSREKLQADVKEFLKITEYDISFEQMSALLLCSFGYHGTNSSWNQNILNHFRQLCGEKLPDVELKFIYDYCDLHYINKNPAKEWLLLSELGGRQIGMSAPHEVLLKMGAECPTQNKEEEEKVELSEEDKRRKRLAEKALEELKKEEEESPKPIENLKEPVIVESWSLLDFARKHGTMKVMPRSTHINIETGEEFEASVCAFIHPTEKDEKGRSLVTFVAFSSSLGELSPKEISAQRNDLIVVQHDNGNYSLKHREEKR